MKRLLIIGCGDVARRTIPLVVRRYRVYALVRNTANCAALRTLGAVPLSGDLDDRTGLSCVAGLADTVLHFAPPQNSSALDTRTRHLLAALSSGALPKQLVYISTSSVYGDCRGAAVSEAHPIAPKTAPAKRRANAEKLIRNWAKRNKVRACILRVPGIYAAERLPLNRLQQGLPCIIDSEDVHTNLIHADDLARIVVTVLRNGSACRVYHACDDSQLKMGGYFDTVAKAFGLSPPPRISSAEAQRVLPESLLSFMNESRQLANQRMKRELKVKLLYPAVADWLAAIKHSKVA
ncbi:MAG TPA: SDR family oxidoreductase [Gallionella sp.]|nr:SDR family oxidoreductase [Gallionella sp.]